MLHLKTVEPRTFSVLKQLLALPTLQNFGLVGGTALSLIYGHRMSVDLDLFSNTNFNNSEITDELKKEFGSSFDYKAANERFGIFCFVDDIKIDIVQHPHTIIRPMYVKDDIRFFSTEDIIAMKVQAVLGRAKKKDFWDIAELLNHYSVADFATFHQEKYSAQNLLISVPQAISYFADADESEDPVCLKKQSWQSIQKQIQKKVSAYLS
jgi:predicted nucleotidyltransferase component of viral defense system